MESVAGLTQGLESRWEHSRLRLSRNIDSIQSHSGPRQLHFSIYVATPRGQLQPIAASHLSLSSSSFISSISHMFVASGKKRQPSTCMVSMTIVLPLYGIAHSFGHLPKLFFDYRSLNLLVCPQFSNILSLSALSYSLNYQGELLPLPNTHISAPVFILLRNALRDDSLRLPRNLQP